MSFGCVASLNFLRQTQFTIECVRVCEHPETEVNDTKCLLLLSGANCVSSDRPGESN